MNINMIHDFVEANGKTIKENNLTKQHQIHIGTLVEVKFDTWFGNGACWKVHARLWVVKHTRDCDGTPLYGISRWDDLADAVQFKDMHGGFPEYMLTPIEITQRIRDGYDALDWEDE